jgi:N-acetylmuramoyl-L-alanine amidase
MAYRDLHDKDVKYLVIHTTASPQKYNWQWIRNYFINILKWSVEGYHVFIDDTGETKRLVDNQYQSNGVREFKGNDIHIHNGNCFNIVYEGGIDEKGNGIDNRTEAQKRQLKAVLAWYLNQYPNLIILGHNQVAKKLCPCFNTILWLREIDVPEKNIYKGDNYNVLKWHFKYDSKNTKKS